LKRKIFSVLLALVLVVSFSLITAVPTAAASTLLVRPYTLGPDTHGTSVWSTAQAKTGSDSVLLTHTTGTGSVYVDFIPPAGETLATFQADITAATPAWSFQHYLENTGVTNGPQFELRFTESGGTGWLEVTAVGLQNYTGTAAWVIETLAGATVAGYGGNTPDGSSVFEWGPLTALSGIEAAVNTAWEAAETGTTASAYVLTRVRVELWEDIDQYCYIDDITIAGVTYYGMIDDAIDVGVNGDTISVAAGTYTEDPVIDAELTLSGPNAAISPNTGTRVTEASIVGTITFSGVQDNVTIQGFSFSYDPATMEMSIYVDPNLWGNALVIQNNIFTATTPTSGHAETAIYVHPSTAAKTGLLIDDNRVTGYRGVYLDAVETGDTHRNTVTITNNVIIGDATTPSYAGISVNAVTGTISDNTITNTYDAGINIGGLVVVSNALDITDNTVTGAGRAEWGNAGAINVWETCTDIDIRGNTLSNSYDGITIKDCSSSLGAGTAINYNHISGNSHMGIDNGAAETLDAARNWWGRATGPYHATTNPGVAGYRGDTVSDNVTYAPWLYLTAATTGDTVAEIVTNQVPAYANSVVLDTVGWNTWSVPIGLDGQYNTWAELYTLTSLPYSMAYYFNPTTQTFVSLATTSTYAIAPGEGFYVKMTAASSIPYCYSTLFSIPSRALGDGWDFIGGGMTTQDEIITCVSIATVGSTAGYTQIISPAENAASWVWYTGVGGSQGDLVLGEGYWTSLPIDRTLNLFDLTPVSWVPLP